MDKEAARDIGNVCMGLHIRRAARRITRVYDDALAPVGLTIGQFSLLTLLAGQENWGMQPLADVLGTDRTSLTASLKPLERRQLVETRSDASDRRLRHLALTPAGRQLLAEAEPFWNSAQRRISGLLGRRNASLVRSALERIA